MKRIIIWSRARHLHLFALISLQRKKTERHPTKICPFDNGARLRHLLRSIILGDEKKQQTENKIAIVTFFSPIVANKLRLSSCLKHKINIYTRVLRDVSSRFKMKKSILYCLESCKLYFTFYLADCLMLHFLDICSICKREQ